MPAPTRQYLTKFDTLHKERFGTPAVIIAGKDAQILARLHKTHAEYIEPLMERFFAERDAFVESRGHTVGMFAGQFARLLKQQMGAESRGNGPRNQAYWDMVYSWRDDCLKTHGGDCENWRAHDLRNEKDAMRERGEL